MKIRKINFVFSYMSFFLIIIIFILRGNERKSGKAEILLIFSTFILQFLFESN